jgi:hypothetical protein
VGDTQFAARLRTQTRCTVLVGSGGIQVFLGYYVGNPADDDEGALQI